ncbi:MAG: V-type ATP synthase subunit F [bacterium]
MKYYCIADEDTVRGFRLAGIDGQTVAVPAEAAQAFESALNRPDIGIIILAQQVAAPLRTQIEAHRLARERPLIVEIPGPGGGLPGHKTLLRSVQEAVGIHIDFKKEPLSDPHRPK